jgi:hypothetical protein
VKHRKKLARLKEAISVNWTNHTPEQAVVEKADLRCILADYIQCSTELEFMYQKYEELDAKYLELLDRFVSGGA